MLPEEPIQVAGVRDEAEARLLCACGVDLIGFPLRLAVHAEDLSEAAAAGIVRRLKPPARAVLITYLDDAEAIAAFCREVGAGVVQLHGDVAPGELARLRSLAPEIDVIKSLVVGRHDEDALFRIANEAAPFVDAFITDTFDPVSGASGATGIAHDWAVSRRLAEAVPRPLILAGGLRPDTVRRAIHEVRPAGVDVHTGVEEETGRKSRELVERFVAEARAGFLELRASRRA